MSNMICEFTKSTEEQLQTNNRLKHHYELGKKREAVWNKKYRNVTAIEFDKINWEENLEGKGFLLTKNEPLGKTKYSDTYPCKLKPGSQAVNMIEQSFKEITQQEQELGLPVARDQNKKIDALACKVIRIKNLSKPMFSLYSKRNFTIWMGLKHGCMINYLKIFATNALDKYYIFMDFAEQGTLTDFIKNDQQNANGLAIEKATNLMIDLVTGLHFLHTNAISHRKLKSDNIFITQGGNLAKIGGYEYFIEFCDYDHNGEKSMCWMTHEHNGFNSIEAIANDPHDPFLEDIFGIGALFYYMLTGKPPFDPCKLMKDSSHQCKDHRSSFKRNITNQVWMKKDHFKHKENEALKNLFPNTFSLNPLNRPSTDELLAMEIFKTRK